MANSKSELQSQLQVALDKVENYKKINDHLLFDMTKLEISKELIEQENHYLKVHIERLSTQIEELMSKKYPNQNLQNQKIMKRGGFVQANEGLF